MKILHLNIVQSGGGVEQYLSQLFQGLEKRGHQNLFIFGQGNGKKEYMENAELFFIDRIADIDCPGINDKLQIVQGLIDEHSPDIAYIHQVLNSSLIDFVTKKLPSVRFAHGFKLVCPDGKKTLQSIKQCCTYPLGYTCQINAYRYQCMPRNLLKGLPLIHHTQRNLRTHLQRSQMVVASEFMKSVLLYNGFEERQVEVVPYFTDLPKIVHGKVQTNDPIILAVGRIVNSKGIHKLIAAFAKIKKSAQLVIVGVGPALNAIKKMTKQLEIDGRVSFTGWLPHHQLDSLYSQCTLVVVPSIWPEPFGIVGIEAMAYQKPVVAFNVGGISEWLIDGETGFLVPPRDEKDLANKINILLANTRMAMEMGMRGREAVEKRFTSKAHLDSLLFMFQKTIDCFQ